MTRFLTCTTVMFLTTLSAFASSAATNASAGRDILGRGNAQAYATYEGDAGFARTNTRTGSVNIARGVAVGVDEDGLSLSVSTAFDPKHGPAIASNFNLSIGRDGSSSSHGLAIANDRNERQASAGGAVTADRRGSLASSTAQAGSGPQGRAIARTSSNSQRPQPRLIHSRPSRQRMTVIRRSTPQPEPRVVRRTVTGTRLIRR
jgi:hypothetical protein